MSFLLRFRDWLREFVYRAIFSVGIAGAVQTESIDAFLYAFRYLVSKLSWLGVRTVGNLQLLTRASYYSLLIVPLIAGVWPFIRNTINQYNQTVETSAQKVIESANELEESIQQLIRAGEPVGLSQALIREELSSTSDSLREIGENFTYLLHDTNMPASFALAFFAALFVAVGHLLFQLFCPEQVKKSNQAEYVESQLSADKVRTEFSLLEDIDLVANRSGIAADELLLRIKSPDYSAMDLLRVVGERETDSMSAPSEASRIAAAEWRQEKDAVLRIAEVAARLRYTSWATQDLGAALVAVALYFGATSLLVIIIGQQVMNVVTAAGWL